MLERAVSQQEPVRARRLAPVDEALWLKHLVGSSNATLFHDPRFLAYHPPGRFDMHHLAFERGAELLAIMPGGVQGDLLVSPCGASVGGPAFGERPTLATATAVLRELQRYVESEGLAGIELRLAPALYHAQPDEGLQLALIRAGFALSGAALGFAIPLDPARPEAAFERFSKGKRYDVRANLKKGLVPREIAGPELAAKLPELHRLMKLTSERHGGTPTHSPEELETLFRLVPGRIRLFLCADGGGREIAAILVFMVNAGTAYTFYICEDEKHRELCGPAVLIAHIAEKLAREGLRLLDLGPSASDKHVNEGVVFFKESLGARGLLRTTWSLRRG